MLTCDLPSRGVAKATVVAAHKAHARKLFSRQGLAAMRLPMQARALGKQ